MKNNRHRYNIFFPGTKEYLLEPTGEAICVYDYNEARELLGHTDFELEWIETFTDYETDGQHCEVCGHLESEECVCYDQ